MNIQAWRAVAALFVGGACALPAWAEDTKAGLWEETTTMPGRALEMRTAFANAKARLPADMPPEQRKVVEKMLADASAKVSPVDDTLRMKRCVPAGQAGAQTPDGNCKLNRSPAVNGRITYSFACPKMTGSGEGTYLRDRWTTKIKVKSLETGREFVMEGKGKWLGADCGKVGPVGIKEISGVPGKK